MLALIALWGGDLEFSAFPFSWKSIRLCTIWGYCLILYSTDEPLVLGNTFCGFSSQIHSRDYQRSAPLCLSIPRLSVAPNYTCIQTHISTQMQPNTFHTDRNEHTSTHSQCSSCKCSVPTVFTVHCRHKSQPYCQQARSTCSFAVHALTPAPRPLCSLNSW